VFWYIESGTKTEHLYFNFETHVAGKRIIVVEPPCGAESEPFAFGVAEFGGVVVPHNCSQVADLAFVAVDVEQPAPLAADLRQINAREILTSIWTTDCQNENAVSPVHFYHRPLPPFVYEQGDLLKGCVIVPTNVVGGLRDYVKMTSKLLGAT
jgi:hypothetical protein